MQDQEIGRLVAAFKQDANVVASSLCTAAEELRRGGIVQEGEQDRLMKGLDSLRTIYRQVYELVRAQEGDRAPVPSGLTVDEYEQRYREYASAHLQEQLCQAVQLFQAFLAVRSRDPAYANALAPVQSEVRRLLDETRGIDAAQALTTLSERAPAVELFLAAMGQDLSTPDGTKLATQLGTCYEPIVLVGLALKKYEKAPGGAKAGSGVTGMPGPAVPQEGLPEPAPETVPAEERAYPGKKLKNLNISASAFRKDIKQYPLEMRAFVPLLTNFGTLTIDQAVRLCRCTEALEEGDELPAKIAQAAEKMVDKNLLAAYRLKPSAQDAYCLTDYCIGCLKKKEVASQMRNYWALTIGTFFYPAAQWLPLKELRTMLAQNEGVIRYFEWGKQACPPEEYTKLQVSLAWEQGVFTVLLPGEDAIRCILSVEGALPRQGSNTPLLYLPEDSAALPSPPGWDGDLYCLAQGTLSRWDGAWAAVPLPSPSAKKKEAQPDVPCAPCGMRPLEAPGDMPPAPPVTPPPPADENRERDITCAQETQAGGAAELARRILRASPASLDAADCAAVILQLLQEKRIMEAAVLAKAGAATRDAAAEAVFRQLLFATNSPLGTAEYSSLAIVDLAGRAQASPLPHETSRILQTCCLLWAYSFPSQAYDSRLFNDYKGVFTADINDLFGGNCGALRQIALLLTGDLYKITFRDFDGRAFSPMALSLIRSDAEKRKSMQKLQERAIQMNRLPRGGIFPGFDTLLARMFGQSSELGQCLRIVEKDREAEFASAKKLVDRFLDGDASLSQKKMEDYIDETWAEVRKQDKEIKVKILRNDSHARNTTKRELVNRLELISEWISQHRGVQQGVSPQAVERLRAIRDQLQQHLETAQQQLRAFLDGGKPAPSLAAGTNVLIYALAEIRRLLLCESEPGHDGQFFPLLTTPYLSLDETYRPRLEPGDNAVEGFEPWRRVLKHLAAPKTKLETALRYMEDEAEGQEKWFANYGVAEMLEAYLKRPQRDFSNACKGAELDCSKRKMQFESEFRLACAYGKIEEDVEETAFRTAKDLGGRFLKQHNYAFFRDLLQHLLKIIPAEVERRRAYFEERLSALAADTDAGQAPIIQHIEAALEEENFALAQEYMNRFQNGEQYIPAVESGGDATRDFHQEFIDCYSSYYRECDKSDNRMHYPKQWARRAFQKAPGHWSSPNEEKKSQRLLESWVEGKGSPHTADLICRFLNAVGFEAREATRQEEYGRGEQYEVYRVSVVPQHCGRRDYEHPVFRYGTALGKVMNVVCLFGSKGTSTVINVMTKKLQLEGPTLVLLEGILSLDERRNLAASFKAMTSGQSSFLLIDRVLLLYLSSLDEGERMIALLKCTLPYTFEQLFTKGTGAVSDEMFFGRIAERNDICNETGACLVYGGRQLGKTALLLRCKSIQHVPARNMYAYHIDIKDKGASALLEELRQVLSKDGLVTGQCDTLDSLCNQLYAAFEQKKFLRLQFFLDEVDYFFGELARQEYELLRPIISLMKKTKNKVKFVFVGLHNVAHTKSAIKNNGLLLQLGIPLCIAPFSSTDARKLIERPLSYLGFHIGERELALILASTNNYPGLLHLFGYSLLQSVCSNYRDYYSPQQGNPPYQVLDAQMKAVFAKEDLEREINRRVSATINDLDKRYKMIANLLAYLHYEDESSGRVNLYGYTPEAIRGVFDVKSLHDLDEDDFEAVLNEMVDMGILAHHKKHGAYRLRKIDFLTVIGKREQVEENILSDLSEA